MTTSFSQHFTDAFEAGELLRPGESTAANVPFTLRVPATGDYVDANGNKLPNDALVQLAYPTGGTAPTDIANITPAEVAAMEVVGGVGGAQDLPVVTAASGAFDLQSTAEPHKRIVHADATISNAPLGFTTGGDFLWEYHPGDTDVDGYWTIDVFAFFGGIEPTHWMAQRKAGVNSGWYLAEGYYAGGIASATIFAGVPASAYPSGTMYFLEDTHEVVVFDRTRQNGYPTADPVTDGTFVVVAEPEQVNTQPWVAGHDYTVGELATQNRLSDGKLAIFAWDDSVANAGTPTDGTSGATWDAAEEARWIEIGEADVNLEVLQSVEITVRGYVSSSTHASALVLIDAAGNDYDSADWIIISDDSATVPNAAGTVLQGAAFSPPRNDFRTIVLRYTGGATRRGLSAIRLQLRAGVATTGVTSIKTKYFSGIAESWTNWGSEQDVFTYTLTPEPFDFVTDPVTSETPGVVYPGDGGAIEANKHNLFWLDETPGAVPAAAAGLWYELGIIGSAKPDFVPVTPPSVEVEHWHTVEDPATPGAWSWVPQGHVAVGGNTSYTLYLSDRLQSFRFDVHDRREQWQAARRARTGLTVEELATGNADWSLTPANFAGAATVPAGFVRLFYRLPLSATAGYDFYLDWRLVQGEYEIHIQDRHNNYTDATLATEASVWGNNQQGAVDALTVRYAATDPAKPTWTANTAYPQGEVLIAPAPAGVTETEGTYYLIEADSARPATPTLDAAEWGNYTATPLVPSKQDIVVDTLAELPPPETVLVGSVVHVTLDGANNGDYTATGATEGQPATTWSGTAASAKNALIYPVGNFTALAVNDSGTGADGAVYKLPTVDALQLTLPNKADMNAAEGIWRARISGDWAALAAQATVLSFIDDTANGVEMGTGLPDDGNEWLDLVFDAANDKWIATSGGDVTLTQVVPTYTLHTEVPANVRLYLIDGTGGSAEGLWRKETVGGSPNHIG